MLIQHLRQLFVLWLVIATQFGAKRMDSWSLASTRKLGGGSLLNRDSGLCDETALARRV